MSKGVLGALAAWRMTQGIYRFDTDIFSALWSTPIEGKIPVEILYRLPEWCVYIEAPPGYQIEDLDLFGWFTHPDWDADPLYRVEKELELLLQEMREKRPA